MKRYVEHVMGMPISLALRGRHADDELAHGAWAAALSELRWVDEVFSTYRRDSWISRLGRGEVGVDQCPLEVAEVLRLGELAAVASDGAFSVWRPELDPSGVVKGWAVDRAAGYLRELDETDFCLSAGGDMVCRSAEQPWRIGIEHPLDPSRLCAVVPVFDGAVATSGAAHRGQHLVDARTGRAPVNIASVTVVGVDLTWADIDATAAYALGDAAVRWLGDRGRQGVVVWADGQISQTASTFGPSRGYAHSQPTRCLSNQAVPAPTARQLR